MTHDDVVVVGAGPAGLSTALFLRAAAPHLRVRVLERKRFPRDKICAGAIGARADRLLARIGVHVEVPSAPVHGVQVCLPNTAPTRVLGDIGRVVRRIEHDEALAQIARGRGIEIEEGVRVDGFEVEPDAVRVQTDAGPRRARVLVGADGVGSVVRRGLALPQSGLVAQVVEVDTEAARTDPPRHVVRFDISRPELPGYVWDFPTLSGGRRLICRGVYALRRPSAPRPDVDAALDAHLRALDLDPDAYRSRHLVERGFEPHRPVARPRVLLVGEAAGIDPLTGEGIAQAIGYGALAARYLAPRLAADRALTFRDWRATVLTSSLGLELTAAHLAARMFLGPARAGMQAALRWTPGALWLTGGHFSGRGLAYRDLAPR